ncbi:lysophospholipid acyltransferase family protein [Streptomyces sp. NPDC002640]
MSPWDPTAPCAVPSCVEAFPRVGRARAAARAGALLALLLAGLAACPFARLLPRRAVRLWCRGVVRAAGARVRTSGAAPGRGGLLLVANHVSWLDVALLASVRPARMVAKAEIRRWPVAGRLAALGAVFIDRQRLRALPGTVAELAELLRGGAAVAVFPEGSSWCGRAQGRFRPAVFQAALDAGVPVQPVRLRYRFADGTPATAAAFVGDDTLLASVWRVVSVRGLVAEVDVRPALPAGSRPDRRALACAAQPHTADPLHGAAGGRRPDVRRPDVRRAGARGRGAPVPGASAPASPAASPVSVSAAADALDSAARAARTARATAEPASA